MVGAGTEEGESDGGTGPPSLSEYWRGPAEGAAASPVGCELRGSVGAALLQASASPCPSRAAVRAPPAEPRGHHREVGSRGARAGPGGIDAYQTCFCEEADGPGRNGPLAQGTCLTQEPLLEKDLACLGDIILFWGLKAHVLALGHLKVTWTCPGRASRDPESRCRLMCWV